MSRASHPTTENVHLIWLARGWAIAACLLLIPPALSAQASQSGSLGDTARQLRAQKQTGADPNQAQQVADELSEDQNHFDDAPGGFKTYNAGDYTLWVPAPFRVSGHDDAGVILAGPSVGTKQPFVLVGTPFLLPPGAPEEAFHDAATHFSTMYTRNATCSQASGNRNVYECSLAVAELNGMRVSGNAWLMRSGNTVYPVLCAAPSDSNNRDWVNNARNYSKENAREALDREEQDVRAVWQKCDTAFQSIRLKEGKAAAAAAQPGAASGPATTSSNANGPTPGAADAAQSPKQTSAQAAATLSNQQTSTVPAGFKIHAFNYCINRNECWDASVLVPVDAQLVSSTCKQYIFEKKIQGSVFLLLAGVAGGDCDGRGGDGADPVRWHQLIDSESKRAPGTYNTISSQTAKVEGKPAIITTMSFRKGLDAWMGKRVEVESNGVPLVVGCLAPRDHFDDGDAICSTLIASLLLP